MIHIARLSDPQPQNGLAPGATDTPADAPLADLIPPEQWEVYEGVIRRLSERHLDFALGGGLAFSHYAHRWRNTKDLDLYIRPADKDAVIAILHESGLRDYFEVQPYDRQWIYRSHNGDGIIVDVIWQMANYRAAVDDGWINRGRIIHIHGLLLRLLPAEELIWSKLYVMQRERCDWGDLLNILFVQAPHLDWSHLLGRVGEDKRVLAALIELFAWLCPDRARELPLWLWGELGIDGPHSTGRLPAADERRIRLLDSRDWFGPNQELPEPARITQPHGN